MQGGDTMSLFLSARAELPATADRVLLPPYLHPIFVFILSCPPFRIDGAVNPLLFDTLLGFVTDWLASIRELLSMEGQASARR